MLFRGFFCARLWHWVGGAAMVATFAWPQPAAATASGTHFRRPRPYTNRPAAEGVVRLPPISPSGTPPAQRAFASESFRLADALRTDPFDAGVEPGSHLGRRLRETGWNICRDYSHYYSGRTLRDLGLGIALAAPLANTSMDHDFRDWWQDDVRSSGTDRAAEFWKVFGEGGIFIPAMACLSLAGHALEDRPVFNLAGDFGDRATRAYLVGAPPVLLMQVLLGASRPGETRHDSQWRPFADSNAVSGHAFLGAVPFITAAQMTDNRMAQAALYLGSACTGWSRINDDAHYLSQAVLGWYMAYLACRSVDATELDLEPVSLIPIAGPEWSGLGLVWRR